VGRVWWLHSCHFDCNRRPLSRFGACQHINTRCAIYHDVETVSHLSRGSVLSTISVNGNGASMANIGNNVGTHAGVARITPPLLPPRNHPLALHAFARSGAGTVASLGQPGAYREQATWLGRNGPYVLTRRVRTIAQYRITLAIASRGRKGTPPERAV